MKITILSDLHLEHGYTQPVNSQNADILVLSGDICVADHFVRQGRAAKASTFRDFFEHVSNEFAHVVYVPGNHEFYGGHIDHSVSVLRREIAAYPNIRLLDNETWDHDGVRFIGTTLWTDCGRENAITMQALVRSMNDFALIRTGCDERYLPGHAVQQHRIAVNYIDQMSRDHDYVVVVGHHAPCEISVAQRYKGDLLNGGYYSDLSGFILDRPQIKLWTHGHMHNSSQYMLGECEVVCNPRGYHPYDLNDEYNENFVVEI